MVRGAEARADAGEGGWAVVGDEAKSWTRVSVGGLSMTQCLRMLLGAQLSTVSMREKILIRRSG